MIPPKEKAKELYKKFYDFADSYYKANEDEQNWYGNVLAGERKVRNESAKQCALIAVDEIRSFIDDQMQGFLDSDWLSYWQQVKQEIEKI